MDIKQNKKTLRFSFLDGLFASGMTGFTQEYFAPFLLALGGAARHIGMLSALPNLFASLVQLNAPGLTEYVKSRRKTIVIFVLLQAMALLPIALSAIANISEPNYFIILVVFFTSFGALANPAWSSLMSDLIPENKRGEYFGWRIRTLGFVTVGATFIAGFILQVMKRINVIYGFTIIFIIAFICRMISGWFLAKMHEPFVEYKKEDSFSFIDFLQKMRTSNFAHFVLFVSLMNFSVNLASPFFPVLMLKNLGFSYLLYTVITVMATLTVYFMIGRWGAHADTVGNLKIIKITSPLIGFIPLLWIINQHPLFLILAQVFSGFAWAGFNISTTNFIYDAVTPQKRTRCISYFNVFNGIALCSGALIGGFLLNKLPALMGHKVLTLFLLSAILRLGVGFYIPSRLKEVRPVEKIKTNRLFFSIIGLRPLLGVERKTTWY